MLRLCNHSPRRACVVANDFEFLKNLVRSLALQLLKEHNFSKSHEISPSVGEKLFGASGFNIFFQIALVLASKERYGTKDQTE